MISQVDRASLPSDPQFGFVVLDDAERTVFEELLDFACKQGDWPAYRNYYIRRLDEFYQSRGLSRDQIIKTPLWKIAQQMSSELQVKLGDAEAPDYRDQLSDLIQGGFDSRRAFCEATGISEDMLSHVLAKRKDFGIETLSDALAKIGFTIHIVRFRDTE